MLSEKLPGPCQQLCKEVWPFTHPVQVLPQGYSGFTILYWGGFSSGPPSLTFERSPGGGWEDIKANFLFAQARLMGTCVGREEACQAAQGSRGRQLPPSATSRTCARGEDHRLRRHLGGRRAAKGTERRVQGSAVPGRRRETRKASEGRGMGLAGPRWLQPLCSRLQNQLGARPCGLHLT